MAERHERRAGHTDSIVLELETGRGVTTVEGGVLLGRARLLHAIISACGFGPVVTDAAAGVSCGSSAV